MKIPPETLEQFEEFVLSSHWKTATSAPMQKYPHQYTLLKRATHPVLFANAVQIIRSFGVPGKFYARFFTYFEHNNWKYWTMNDPISEVHLINRAAADQTYGRQDAPAQSKVSNPSIYDYLAPVYDLRYQTEECQEENKAVLSLLGDISRKRILDVGCGTGLLLDICKISPSLYRGIDPSQGMVNEFLRKHPSYAIDAVSLNDCKLTGFDLAVGLFGVASYLTIAEISKIASLAESWFLMFYVEGYRPSYYTSKVEWDTKQQELFNAVMDLGKTEVIYLSNYVIAKGHHGLEA